jgi:hypothetical protein
MMTRCIEEIGAECEHPDCIVASLDPVVNLVCDIMQGVVQRIVPVDDNENNSVLDDCVPVKS